MSQTAEQADAAAAAAAIAADIDAMSAERLADLPDVGAEELQVSAEVPDSLSGPEATTYLLIKELRSISRARSLRLQPEDVIVAVDGQPFQKDMDTFLDIMFECDPDNGVVLSIWRQGIVFNVIARGPLGCVLEHAKPEVSEKATADFVDVVVEPPENYTTFEVLRDIFRNCIVLDTRLSPTAMIFPPIWCLQNRLWEVLVATFLVYGITLAVHWVLFIIAYVVLAIYFKKAHLVLRRSFAMMRGRHIWLVLAAKSELEAQRLCRKLDAKSVFVPDLVGPPVTDEPPKKRRRRRGK
ncbi:MAG: hypothetical protein VX047_03610 [Pseudomonadota bacterium]|nr:hypothetical protein [Pseudomonadota bacterium]